MSLPNTQRRASGLLLHITSLPGPFGIGDLGPAAHDVVAKLGRGGQSFWQMLPVGPTGFGNSPYQSSSTFAGNPWLISPDVLVDQGLVEVKERDAIVVAEGRVDYDVVSRNKRQLLRRAAERFATRASSEQQQRYAEFCDRKGSIWLDDYSLYAALKEHQTGRPWNRWDPDLARRDQTALDRARTELASEVDAEKVIQFLFFDQWPPLRETAHEHGVGLVGDLPLYVAHDSADVWANPGLFQLDERGEPTVVAGVPPDYFSTIGQRWGNPIFDWEELASLRFRWWRSRVVEALELFDRLRLDHFRGIAGYWAIPADEPTAEHGRWVSGPGAELLQAVADEVGDLPLIAEDLGLITDDVVAIRETFGLPGMRIAQFGFDRVSDTALHHPDNYPEHVWAYTGTHDNDTTRGWFWESNPKHRLWKLRRPRRILYRRVGGRIPWGLVEMVAGSRAMTAMFPVQDILGLGSDARMNTPGTTSGNWEWRLRSDQLSDESLHDLRGLTLATGRAS